MESEEEEDRWGAAGRTGPRAAAPLRPRVGGKERIDDGSTLRPAFRLHRVLLEAVCCAKMLIKHFGVLGTEEGGRG